MAKVLISFLGTGRLKKTSSSRDYIPTTYRINETDYSCSFVSAALREHYKIDKMILIGTTHSMWEEVYNVYAEPKDGTIFTEIGDCCERNTHESPLEIPHKEKIEQAMGKGSKVVLVKYGITQEEILYNSEIILALESSLNKGDELYVDITHSFRSLPLFIMNLLIYLRDVSSKKIRIAGIYYGMLEATNEIGHTPIVDLSEVLNVNSWISGAYSFMEFGNAYKISKLLESLNIDNPKRISAPLKLFTEAKNLNHLAELENQVRKLQGIKELEGLPTIAKMVIEPVVSEFLSTVQLRPGKFGHSDFQYQLAVWHHNNHNYAAAYISLSEAIVTRGCELYGFDSGSYQCREEIKSLFAWARGRKKLEDNDLLEFAKTCDKGLLKVYGDFHKRVTNNRNAIAHSQRGGNGCVVNTVKVMIEQLDEYIKEYQENFS